MPVKPFTTTLGLCKGCDSSDQKLPPSLPADSVFKILWSKTPQVEKHVNFTATYHCHPFKTLNTTIYFELEDCSKSRESKPANTDYTTDLENSYESGSCPEVKPCWRSSRSKSWPTIPDSQHATKFSWSSHKIRFYWNNPRVTDNTNALHRIPFDMLVKSQTTAFLASGKHHEFYRPVTDA
jgi:hypothetical protein